MTWVDAANAVVTAIVVLGVLLFVVLAAAGSGRRH